MKLKSITIGLLATVLCAPVSAEPQSQFEIYLGAAHYFWDGDRDLDDSTSLELGGEIPLNEELSFEAWISDFDADTEVTSIELGSRRYAAGALYHLSDGDYRPFLSAGAAHQEFDVPNASEIDETLLYVGAGAKKYFDNNLILRGELLAMNSLDHEFTDLGVRLALGYAFGRDAGTPAPTAPSQIVATKQAPTEKQAAKPVPPAKPEKIIEKDTDGDGVMDSKDQCADTDANFKVDEKGCPVTLMKTLSIDLHVKFKTNSAEFSDDSGEVKELAEFLNKYAQTTLVIEGHTDSAGSAAYNKSLSQKRADSVKAMLVNNYGIDDSRVDAIGYGEERPIASNDTAEGRAQNRRVIGKVSAVVETKALK